MEKTSLGVPLTQKSGHPPTICKSWPMAELRRVGTLCSSNKTYEENRTMMVDRLRKYGYSQEILRSMENYYPWLAEINKNKTEMKTKVDPEKEITKIRFITGYHPTTAKVIRKAIREIHHDVVMVETLESAYGKRDPFRIETAFRNVAKSVGKLVI